MARLSAIPGRVIGRLLTPKGGKEGNRASGKKGIDAGKATVKLDIPRKPAVGAGGKGRGAAIPGRVLGLADKGVNAGLGREKPKVEIRVPAAGKKAAVKLVAGKGPKVPEKPKKEILIPEKERREITVAGGGTIAAVPLHPPRPAGDSRKNSMDVSEVVKSLKTGETAAIKTDGGHNKVRDALKELLESPVGAQGEKDPGGGEEEKIQKKAGKSLQTIERINTGITGLDKLVEGGFEKGSAILVVGSAGTGKTLFSLQYLYYGALLKKEPGIFISFEEGRDSLIRHSSSFGWDFERLERENLFRILEYRPHQAEKLVTQGGGPIKDAIREMGATRLVMDSVTAYGLLFREEYQKRENIIRLIDLLKSWGVTSLLISELPPKVAEIKEGSIGFLTDAVISLYYSKKSDSAVRVHSCEILKMRGTKHTNKLLAIGFEKEGIAVYPEVEVF